MFKIKLKFSKLIGLLLIVFCFTFLAVNVAHSQQLPLVEAHKTSAAETSKHKLATEVLLEIGIAKRYDMHFDHSMGTLIIGNGSDLKLLARFRKMFVRELGWKHFKDAYAARLEADFSEDELKELLNLSKQPVVKKLLLSESKAYMDTSKQRLKMGFELWDNYNNDKVSLPPE
jgi:hypothetical protein